MLNTIEELKKEDQRINLIKNQKNIGILYTRSIGSLAANGKYIFPLDNDDLFIITILLRLYILKQLKHILILFILKEY